MNRTELTEETENLFRNAYIALDDILKNLRDLFEDKFQKTFKQTWVDNGTV